MSQTSTTFTRTLSEMHLIASPHANKKNPAARLENLPKELVDLIILHLEPRDLGALSATSKHLNSQLLDRKFEHLDFYLCKSSEQKLDDIKNITSHERFRLTVRSVIMRAKYCVTGGLQTTPPDQEPKFLPLLQQAANLTHLTVWDAGDADALFPAITFPNLKQLSLFHIEMDLDPLIDFIKMQPKFETVHIDGASIQDVELGDVREDLTPMDWNDPPIEEWIKGFRVSVLIRERTPVRNIVVNEGSDRIQEPWQKNRRRSQEWWYRWSGHNTPWNG